MSIRLLSSVFTVSFFQQAADIAIVYYLIYRFILWIKATQAVRLLLGLFWVFGFYFVSLLLGFKVLNWILEILSTVVLLLFIIIFQPEIRRFLECLGSGRMFLPLMTANHDSTVIIKQLLQGIDRLSKQKIGGLIVIENGSNLDEYIDSGVALDAAISSELIVSLFWPGNLTHDGAVIIRENKIAAAGCLLPLTNTMISDRRLGTRHRAALGLAEKSDSLVIVVSEETGIISFAENGALIRYLNREALETRLFNLYKPTTTRHFSVSISQFLKKLREPREG